MAVINEKVEKILINTGTNSLEFESGGDAPVPSVVEDNDVRFYDYDGTLVASYSPSDFANLSSLPDNPVHSGLTAQGWNWTLADAKAYVAKYGMLDIGQMYITDDGNTRLYLSLDAGRLSTQLGLFINGSVDVDWGDDSEHSTMTGTNATSTAIYASHTYAAKGRYVISIEPAEGTTFNFAYRSDMSMLLTKSSYSRWQETYVYLNALVKIEIGTGITSIRTYSLARACSLEAITMPNSITDIEASAFEECASLKYLTIPNSMSTLRNSFTKCYSLFAVSIPKSVTTIVNGTFKNCQSLRSIALPPDCTDPVRAVMFSGCYSLQSVAIPEGTTWISNAFGDCYSLQSLTIPSTVTGFTTDALYYCYGLGYIEFLGETPPTAGSSGVFGMPTDCVIYVPAGTLETYKAAANYPSPSSYTYIERD